MATRPLAQLFLCCNDRAGNFTGRVEAINLDHPAGETAEFEGEPLDARWRDPQERDPNEEAAPNILELSGLGRFGVWRHRPYVGNIFWDLVGVRGFTLIRFLEGLRARNWSCACAPTEFFELWQVDRPITIEEWIEVLKP